MYSRSFGSTGIAVGAIGFGAAPLLCDAHVSVETATAFLEQVFAAGVDFVDVADTYCREPFELHFGERAAATALRRSGATAWIATKGGAIRTTTGWQVDSRPDRLLREIEASFQALGGVEPIFLWQHHWPDPRFSLRDTLGVVRRAVEVGLIRHVGVCNYSLRQLQEARDAIDVVSVQNQFNFWRREAETEGILEYCERENLVFLPWRPLGGAGLAERLPTVPALAAIARERKVSVQCATLAWLLGKSKCILPIPGSRTPRHLYDGLAATELNLDERERAALDRIRPSDLVGRQRPAAWIDSPPLSPLRENG